MTRAWLRRSLPDAAALRANRGLRWLGPLLERPWLWQSSRRSIAVGLSTGLFFGLLIPFGQALAAGVAAAWLRGNLAAAVLATFVSNPLTTPFILVGAYQVGAAFFDAPAVATDPAVETGWLERLAGMGEPLLVGLLIVSGFAAALGYGAMILAWRLASLARLKRLRARRRA